MSRPPFDPHSPGARRLADLGRRLTRSFPPARDVIGGPPMRIGAGRRPDAVDARPAGALERRGARGPIDTDG
jgi:hypothetical protein